MPMIKILAVDDQQLNLDILCEMLDGFIVRTAQFGSEAVQIAKVFQPDIVLLDVMMPVVGGLETCHLLRQLPQLDQCRIIMVSAKAMAHERLEGLDAGADDYLTKPFDEESLWAMIEQYCGKAQLTFRTK